MSWWLVGSERALNLTSAASKAVMVVESKYLHVLLIYPALPKSTALGGVGLVLSSNSVARSQFFSKGCSDIVGKACRFV